MTKVIKDFINYLKKNNKADLTLSNYQSDLKIFVDWFEKKNADKFAIYKITPTDVRNYKEYLLQQKFKPNTVNRRILSLKSFLNWAWSNNKGGNVFQLPKLVNQEELTIQWLNQEQQRTLLTALEEHSNKRDRAIIRFLLNTGLIVSELCILKWLDVQEKQDRKFITVESKSTKESRQIPLNTDAIKALLDLGYNQYKDSDKYIFIGQRGALSSRGVQLIFKRLFRDSKINITPHVLRHTFCKNLVNSGTNLEIVALLAGHKNLDLTRKLYGNKPIVSMLATIESINNISND